MRAAGALAAAAAFAVGCTASPAKAWLGFNLFAANGNGTWSSDGGRASVAELVAATGAGAVTIVPTWFQDTLNSTSVQPDKYASFGAHDIAAAASTFRSAGGGTVILKPHVDCKCGTWRAKIGTEFTAEWQWKAWFASYTEYMVSMARIAEAQGLDALVVGTEMIGTSGREADWRAVVAACRAAFPSGKLLYASNWGAEGWQVQWWDALDFIGVDAYFPLSRTPDPAPASLPAAWEPVLANLSALSQRWGGKPVVFTEVGYRSASTAAVEPGVWSGQSRPDLKAQANLYTALFDTPLKQPWLRGVLLWSWGNDPLQGGPCDDGYTPHRKPAEAVARAAFTGRAAAAAAPGSRAVPRAGAASLTAYSDGALAPGWQSWSFSGTFDPSDKASPPLPGHSASYSAADVRPYGAVSLRGLLPGAAEAGLNATALLLANASLSFALRSAAPNATIQASLCFCDSCSGCPVPSTTRPIGEYLPEAAQCDVPTDWSAGPAAVTAVIPVTDLFPVAAPGSGLPRVPPGTEVRRITISNGNSTSNATFWLDNVRIVVPA